MVRTKKIARFLKIRGLRYRPVSMPFSDLFVRFHQVLEENTKAMEIIMEMEDKLGGEYVFDRKFLEDMGPGHQSRNVAQCLSLQCHHRRQIFRKSMKSSKT